MTGFWRWLADLFSADRVGNPPAREVHLHGWRPKAAIACHHRAAEMTHFVGCNPGCDCDACTKLRERLYG